MTKTMHTPGPWKAEWGTRVSYNYQDWQVLDKNETELCIDIPNGPEAEANARLIAAAPELLEALRNLVFTAEKLWKDSHPFSTVPTITVTHPIIETAKQAITKATGGQP